MYTKCEIFSRRKLAVHWEDRYSIDCQGMKKVISHQTLTVLHVIISRMRRCQFHRLEEKVIAENSHFSSWFLNLKFNMQSWNVLKQKSKKDKSNFMEQNLFSTELESWCGDEGNVCLIQEQKAGFCVPRADLSFIESMASTVRRVDVGHPVQRWSCEGSDRNCDSPPSLFK